MYYHQNVNFQENHLQLTRAHDQPDPDGDAVNTLTTASHIRDEGTATHQGAADAAGSSGEISGMQ